MWRCEVCNTEMPDVMSTCNGCGHRNQFVADALSQGTRLAFALLRPHRGPSFTVSPPGGEISGEGSQIAPEVFERQDVSIPHCEITCPDGAWMIADLGSTNGTDVNGARIPSHVLTALPLPCKLCVGGLVLTVQEELIAPPPPTEADEPEPVTERWFIVCPNTRQAYPAADADARMSECTCCQGMMRRRISQVRPVKR